MQKSRHIKKGIKVYNLNSLKEYLEEVTGSADNKFRYFNGLVTDRNGKPAMLQRQNLCTKRVHMRVSP